MRGALRRLLRHSGVSQRELARRLGVTEGRVSQILRASNPTVRTVARVADALGYRADFRLAVRVMTEQERVWSLAT